MALKPLREIQKYLESLQDLELYRREDIAEGLGCTKRSIITKMNGVSVDQIYNRQHYFLGSTIKSVFKIPTVPIKIQEIAPPVVQPTKPKKKAPVIPVPIPVVIVDAEEDHSFDEPLPVAPPKPTPPVQVAPVVDVDNTSRFDKVSAISVANMPTDEVIACFRHADEMYNTPGCPDRRKFSRRRNWCYQELVSRRVDLKKHKIRLS